MDFLTLLGSLCTLLSVAFVWPQVARVYRMHSVEGIAPNGTLHGVAATCLWAVYGAATGVVPLTISNLTVLAAMLLIGAAQVRHRVLAGRTLALTLCASAAVALLSAAVSPVLTGVIAIAVGATSILPQAIHVLRADDLSGVSVTTYGLLVLTALAWSSYGLLIGDWLVVAPNALVLPCSALIAVKAMRAQTSAALVPEPHGELVATP